ncbi:4'-phosphopantetheinyl transferase family protein [Flavobacterium sandaracinum]|uniref:4-phosphopantetheinyl transferase family protein n=1 Tax=Flavobacterium sandaracinum TaxID=2541733 RepID=A0A4R5CN08_9FLAO|nr:4'-phosphopantetheinyl transferase superfamily protein [Flavobacterium sandaracinum]TDE00640.1 4-phosphopantetheinyl transferase family protein [Flavobacterium sandaracinum]
MIGNDIVDLALARKESNWKRKGFLDKIFTLKEQFLIANAINPEIMVWNLWTRKEAAYKIYNRETGIRGYIPLQLECFYENATLGTVSIKEKIYFTKGIIENNSIYTIAVTNKNNFDKIESIDSAVTLLKNNGIPFVIDSVSKKKKAVSITHHGRFWKGITLLD